MEISAVRGQAESRLWPTLAVTMRRLLEDYQAGQVRSFAALLAKACAAAHGQPVKAFIDGRRLIEAKHLLVFTIRSVEDVAYEVGFRDPAYFSRFFRKHAGAPPDEWRLGQAHGSSAEAG